MGKRLAIVGIVFLLVWMTAAAAETDSYCDNKCGERCSKAGRMDRCLKYCGICCKKCHCVPPGTSGNKDECPCYRDMKNSKGDPKCP
ncbi:peamaclein-like [Andrographis paniculata]|uniref:peamaclein-like n=1 Tax=Andrographis paniculata TaxID=175694 RepID=UPI0021E78946|nr:peamaclein-like [Andrographis paniculata]